MDFSQKIIAIHQPNYIPWLGLFYKIYQSDIFVFHDDVQFSKKGMHNFHYIKTKDEHLRLKIPVLQSHGDLINQVKTMDELNWKKEHLRRLKDSYSKAPYFKIISNDFEVLLNSDYKNLASMNEEIIKFICLKFGIDTEFVTASTLNLSTSREEKVLDIISALNGTVYYSGTGAAAYQNENDFTERGIELRYSTFKPFEYPQFWGKFESNISILDYLMHCGYDWENVLINQQK